MAKLLQKRAAPYAQMNDDWKTTPEVLSPGSSTNGDFVSLDPEDGNLDPDSLIGQAVSLKAMSVGSLKKILANADDDAPVVISDRNHNVVKVKASFLYDEDVKGRTVYFPFIELQS